MDAYDSLEFEMIVKSLRDWAETAGLGPLRENERIHTNGRVLRWARTTITLRTSRAPRELHQEKV
jgi:hypothetical protein